MSHLGRYAAAAVMTVLLGAGAWGENPAAASRSLERAISLLSAGDWPAAAFEARLGETYAPSWADFPYVVALASTATGKPRAEAVVEVERSLSPGLFWRSYSRSAAAILCASLYADTLRYREALNLLDGLDIPPTPEADLARLRSLYGLGRLSEARALAAAALDRWPYDARFPREFLSREHRRLPDPAALRVSETVVSRLYLWEDDDRELLLLAVPFIHDSASRIRNIRTYRAMGVSDRADGALSPLSALRALEYGLIDEVTALDEVLVRGKPIDLSVFEETAALCASDDARKRLADFILSFAGTVSLDRNADGIGDGSVSYRLGRPVQASLDPNQDGIVDFEVQCGYGDPTEIILPDAAVEYDTYPYVRSVTRGDERWDLRPRSLAWAPVSWIPRDYGLVPEPFYTIEPAGSEPVLTDRLLEANAYSRSKPADLGPGGVERILYREGSPVSSEVRLDGRMYAWSTWKGGVPVLSRIDRDGDGYAETTQVNDASGTLRSVAIDRDGDSRVDYREEYSPDGSSRMAWDSDENGRYELVRSLDPVGTERIEWTHPVTGLPVTVLIEKGSPRSVSYNGEVLPVVRDPRADLWWIGMPPSQSRDYADRVLKRVNRAEGTVVVLTKREDGVNIQAVVSGGLVFAELLDR